MEHQSLSLTDITVAFHRRIWTFVLTVAIGIPLALAVAYLLPPVYKSTARILVESQQIPTDLARSTVTASAAERLQLIEQRLMTRDNIISVISRLGLYADRSELTSTEKVEMLRDATEIEMIGYGSTQRRGDPVTVATFTISFASDRPNLSANVANEFVTMVIEQNLRVRSDRASETNDFFKEEVDRLAGELLAIEGQITSFKRANEVALPDSLEFRRASLANLEQRAFDREQRRIGLEDSRRTLVQARESGGGVPSSVPRTPDERELHSLEQTYAQQSAVYAESHPAMRALAARIQAMRSLMNLGGDSEESTLRETELERQIDLIDTQLALVEKQGAEDAARKTALEKSIADTPEVEMALNALVRRHSDLQVQYQQAVTKQAEAETGEKLEVNRHAERFEVIEQAQVPEAPEAPNRTLIAAVGVFASVALGLALAVVGDLANAAIRSPRDLERYHELYPVAIIPYIRTAAEVHFSRLRMAAVALALIIVIPSGLFAVDKYYLPLPLIAERVIDTLGLDTVIELIERRM